MDRQGKSDAIFMFEPCDSPKLHMFLSDFLACLSKTSYLVVLSRFSLILISTFNGTSKKFLATFSPIHTVGRKKNAPTRCKRAFSAQSKSISFPISMIMLDLCLRSRCFILNWYWHVCDCEFKQPPACLLNNLRLRDRRQPC